MQLGKGSDARMYVHSWFNQPSDKKVEREIYIRGLTFLVRRRTSDRHVINEVFRRKVYSEPPRGVVVDLGANIGAYALYAARTATRVYSFEPEESNFEQLEKNVALNHALPISVFKKAVGGINGRAQLHQTKINKGAASLVFDRGLGKQPVEVVTLEHALSLCGVPHVDMLKIDVEGSEYALFENASVHTLRRIDNIVMEVHRVPKKRISFLLKTLRNAGFRVHIRRTRLWPLGMRVVFATRASKL